MDLLSEICKMAKCSVNVDVNRHRDYYESATYSINERAEHFADVDKSVMDMMVETDTIVEITVYPDTPIGSYTVLHYDLNEGLKEMLEILKEDRKQQ